MCYMRSYMCIRLKITKCRSLMKVESLQFKLWFKSWLLFFKREHHILLLLLKYLFFRCTVLQCVS